MRSDAELMSAADARELATDAHGDQRDRDGSLHIDHVSRVAQTVSPDDAVQRVAWLHDVIEDCELTIEDLEPKLTAAERDALLLLTHNTELDSYADYIQRIIDARDHGFLLGSDHRNSPLRLGVS